MKKILKNLASYLTMLVVAFLAVTAAKGQGAVVSQPLGIGKNCGGSSTTDSFRVMSYSDITKVLSLQYKCKPNLGGGTPTGPGFASTAGSIAFNPKDQNVYFIATTTGNNSFAYHWGPNTCPVSPRLGYSYYYPNDFVVGLDFDPNSSAGDGYQLEFTGSSPNFTLFLRKVNIATGYFGPSDTLKLSGGKRIYSQNGDIIFTPMGDLYFAFDNKLFKIDYSNYGNASLSVNATFIDSLRWGSPSDYITGIAYAHGKFIGSVQRNSGSPCSWSSIDISSGSAVITPVTLPANNYTATDMATMINGIGVAEKVSQVTKISNSQWVAYYDVKIRNFGNTILNNVQLTSDMYKTFGAVLVSAAVSPLGTLPAGLALNPAYDGKTNTNLFLGGSTSVLNTAPADSATVRIAVTLNNPDFNTIYYNSSIGTGSNAMFLAAVTDSSNNDGGLRADLNNNGVPDDANEGVRTPLQLSGLVTLADKVINLNAAYVNGAVPVRWAMAHVENGMQVNIQRSTDGKAFHTIGFIFPAATDVLNEYTWLDKQPSDKNNFYRLEITDIKGNATFSEVVLVYRSKNVMRLQVAPVPFKESFNITVQLNRNDKIRYKLLNMQGAMVKNGEHSGQQGENQIRVNDLSTLAAGTYLLQLTVGDEVMGKVVVKSW
jgi:Secretion system C-terminal sorting domain